MTGDWDEWEREHYVVFPWTREAHRIGCGCPQYGGPATRVMPDDAAALVALYGFSPGPCIEGR